MHNGNLGRKELISAYKSLATLHHWVKSGEKLKAGTGRQALMQILSRGAASWLAPRDLLNLLSYTTQNHQLRGDTT